jgi:UDP-N-acetylglucosamine:LPS N-acetylglucosamine transferase
MKNGHRKVMAIASGGGHWQQLMRLRDGLPSGETLFVTTNAAYADQVPGADLRVVTDANRDRPVAMARLCWDMLALVLRTRPDVVVSTGAAPGLIGIVFARALGAKTLWIDSIANAERVSLSGRLARHVAQKSLTQWPHLAGPGGPDYQGKVL